MMFFIFHHILEMLCYAMLCYAMRCGMLCYAMRCGMLLIVRLVRAGTRRPSDPSVTHHNLTVLQHCTW